MGAVSALSEGEKVKGAAVYLAARQTCAVGLPKLLLYAACSILSVSLYVVS